MLQKCFKNTQKALKCFKNALNTPKITLKCSKNAQNCSKLLITA